MFFLIILCFQVQLVSGHGIAILESKTDYTNNAKTSDGDVVHNRGDDQGMSSVGKMGARKFWIPRGKRL